MVIIPIENSLLLTDTTIHLKKEHLEQDGLMLHETVVLVLKKENGRFYSIGFVGNVESLEDDQVAIHLFERIKIDEIDMKNDYVSYHRQPDIIDISSKEEQEQLTRLKNQMIQTVSSYYGNSDMPRLFMANITTWHQLGVQCAPYFQISKEDKIEIMKTDSLAKRIEIMTRVFQEALTMLELTKEAQEDNDQSYQKVYREAAIKKQIQYLQKQLDDMHPEEKSQLQIFEEQIEASGMNETARKEAEKVLRRLKNEGQESHESGLLNAYLEFVTSLDWKKHDMSPISLREVEEILDQEHYGLKKVKERILQQMAVMALKQKQSGSILLFVGPPGTGKTSIAQAIADAMDRNYVRISLGGVRDEADIRGHRRTYIGAMAGRIMDGIKKSGSSNPVMVLDEIDKLSTSFQGDPASALLEVLDPEQNHSFTDHYMNVPYDLSDVMFICTANSLDTIPAPLLDRMEVIPFNGYTPLEKEQIASKHLLKKALDKNGIPSDQFAVEDDVYATLISNYTMESGVRGLKKQLDILARKAAVEFVKDPEAHITITNDNLDAYMDQRKIHHEKVGVSKAPGVVTGLAWTSVGGEILFVETLFTKGKGRMHITGQLGDVMKESAQIAISLVKTIYPEAAKTFETHDLHIHVPAGATPKDGPSAGITLTTALASLVSNTAVDGHIAMTGEVSLQGKVMPIGGLPEKLMAAQRAGVKKVFIPRENVQDLKEVAQEVLDVLEIIPVDEVQDVLKQVL